MGWSSVWLRAKSRLPSQLSKTLAPVAWLPICTTILLTNILSWSPAPRVCLYWTLLASLTVVLQEKNPTFSDQSTLYTQKDKVEKCDSWCCALGGFHCSCSLWCSSTITGVLLWWSCLDVRSAVVHVCHVNWLWSSDVFVFRHWSGQGKELSRHLTPIFLKWKKFGRTRASMQRHRLDVTLNNTAWCWCWWWHGAQRYLKQIRQDRTF